MLKHAFSLKPDVFPSLRKTFTLSYFTKFNVSSKTAKAEKLNKTFGYSNKQERVTKKEKEEMFEKDENGLPKNYHSMTISPQDISVLLLKTAELILKRKKIDWGNLNSNHLGEILVYKLDIEPFLNYEKKFELSGVVTIFTISFLLHYGVLSPLTGITYLIYPYFYFHFIKTFYHYYKKLMKESHKVSKQILQITLDKNKTSGNLNILYENGLISPVSIDDFYISHKGMKKLHKMLRSNRLGDSINIYVEAQGALQIWGLLCIKKYYFFQQKYIFSFGNIKLLAALMIRTSRRIDFLH